MKELPAWWGNPDVAGPRTDSDEYHQFSLWWHRKLYDAGYFGLAWPKEYGGRGATIMEQVVFSEEMAGSIILCLTELWHASSSDNSTSLTPTALT
jgi:alkylation response protein AidB-like acyl-CoA dehydrogenase